MAISRQWVTPLTAGAFLLSAVTGALMFFHLDTGLNKAAHEWLSWALLAGGLLHLVANFGAFRNHIAKRRGQLLVGSFALLLVLSFFITSDEHHERPFAPPVRALAEAPLSLLAEVAKTTPEQLRQRLTQAGLQATSDQQSIAELVGADMGKQLDALGAALATKGE